MRKNITFFILQVLVCLFFSEFAVKAQPGSLDWAMGIGGAGADAGNALALDSAGNVYIAGSFSGTAAIMECRRMLAYIIIPFPPRARMVQRSPGKET